MCNESENYETLAVELKDKISECLAEEGLILKDIEKKQKIQGSSGTSWEVDARGVLDSGDILIIECRRRKRRSSQSEIGELAYRIKDCRAIGGIIITGCSLQKGASIVAKFENIHHIMLDLGSTKIDYVMKYLSRAYAYAGESVGVSENLSVLKKSTDTISESS